VHHSASASWVLVLEEGRISHQGTPAQVQNSGYDLSAQSTTKAATLRSTNNTDVANLTQEKEDDNEDDEMTKQFTSHGLAPYKFFFHASGWNNFFIAMVGKVGFQGCPPSEQVTVVFISLE
jgi:hypothetical protein